MPNAGENLCRLNDRIDRFDKQLREKCKQLIQDHKKPLIISGDMNVVH